MVNDRQIALNGSEITYAEELASQKSSESKQGYDSAFTGSLGKLSAEKFLKQYNWEINPKFRDPTNSTGNDIQISHLRVTVRSWKEKNWDDWGRCVPLEQKAVLPQNSDLIIWVTIDIQSADAAVGTIRGFNWTEQIATWPQRQTGPEAEQKSNVQAPNASVISIQDFPLKKNEGPTLPLPLPEILATNGNLSVGKRLQLQNFGYTIIDPRETKLRLALLSPSIGFNQHLINSYNSLKINNVSAGLLLANLPSILSQEEMQEVEDELRKFDRVTDRIARGETALLVASLARKNNVNQIEFELREPCEDCEGADTHNGAPKRAPEMVGPFICGCCGVRFQSPSPSAHIHQKLSIVASTAPEASQNYRFVFTNTTPQTDFAEINALTREIWEIPKPKTGPREAEESRLGAHLAQPKITVNANEKESTINYCDASPAKVVLIDEDYGTLKDSLIRNFAVSTGLAPCHIHRDISEIANSLAAAVLEGLGKVTPSNQAPNNEPRVSEFGCITFEELKERYFLTLKTIFSHDQIVSTLCMNMTSAERNSGVFIHGVDSPKLSQALAGALPTIVKNLLVGRDVNDAGLGVRDWIEDCKYSVGDQIEHEYFKRGIVINVYSRNGRDRIDVQFSEFGLKTLVTPNFAYSLVRE